MGETPEYDAEYSALYQKLLTELDLIIWVLRADDRARAVDIITHRSLLLMARMLPVSCLSSAADRIPPLPELAGQAVPSTEQCLSLAVISSQIAGQFPSSFPVMAVSAHTGYKLHALVELMIHALPVQASSAFIAS